MAASEDQEIELRGQRAVSGCAFAFVIFNGLLFGLIAASFAHGPYSSDEQELWYRYGSLGLLLSGAIIPGAALLLGARRSYVACLALLALMTLTLLAGANYLFYSGGGV